MSSINCSVNLYLIYFTNKFNYVWRMGMDGNGEAYMTYMSPLAAASDAHRIEFYLPLDAEPATTTRLPLRVRAFVCVR
jgi:hypothetical protein